MGAACAMHLTQTKTHLDAILMLWGALYSTHSTDPFSVKWGGWMNYVMKKTEGGKVWTKKFLNWLTTKSLLEHVLVIPKCREKMKINLSNFSIIKFSYASLSCFWVKYVINSFLNEVY